MVLYIIVIRRAGVVWCFGVKSEYVRIRGRPTSLHGGRYTGEV